MQVQAAGLPPRTPEGVGQLMVRNREGGQVPLRSVVAARLVDASGFIDRLDLTPAVTVTANPAAGVSLEKARRACEAAFEQARGEAKLPSSYRLR